jgi:hypothetical protein
VDGHFKSTMARDSDGEATDAIEKGILAVGAPFLGSDIGENLSGNGLGSDATVQEASCVKDIDFRMEGDMVRRVWPVGIVRDVVDKVAQVNGVCECWSTRHFAKKAILCWTARVGGHASKIPGIFSVVRQSSGSRPGLDVFSGLCRMTDI